MVLWARLLSLTAAKWYLEQRGCWKILAGSWNLGNVFDKSWSLVSAWFVFTFFESWNFLPKSLWVEFLTRISVSWRVSHFTIRHPFLRVLMGLTDNWQITPKIYVTTDICLGFYWQMQRTFIFCNTLLWGFSIAFFHSFRKMMWSNVRLSWFIWLILAAGRFKSVIFC